VTPVSHAIEAAVADVLERMFFAEAFPGETEPAGAFGPNPVTAALSFRGQLSGRLTVVVSACSARRLTADFLGLDASDQVSGEAARDVAAEMANMICGAVLSRVSSQGCFDLTSPEPLREPDSARSQSADCRTFQLGDGLLEVCMDWEASARDPL
jgi:CheY-specific phosphatase CheX